MPSSPSTRPPQLILFDLDNTLFSHTHSLDCALSSIQCAFPKLSTIPLPHLLTTYNAALQTAYNRYLTGQIPFSSTHALKIQLFYSSLDLPPPNDEEIASENIHMLKRLRDEGYKTGIVTNGQVGEQEEKASVVGVRELVDCLVTSEEVGVCKPDRRIFERAVEMLGADVKGALGAGVKAVLYEEGTQRGMRVVDGREVEVIGRMEELLELLGIT
ncbi:hypothetical protein IFR04_007664 [Cadophora malorum]|uniref:HAD-like protein n=1 Tax=Cadophora malorum TaxID=108018 RepID=A0A8H7THU7_9HELO|nr:hypothetical protein IFR04_007664 [Cadophora malorum]